MADSKSAMYLTEPDVVHHDEPDVVHHDEPDVVHHDEPNEERLINRNNESTDSSSSEVKSSEKVHVTNLPAEISQHILRYLKFDHIAKLRLVSRYFNDMCSSLLNSEFNRLRVIVQQRFLAIKAQMPRRESSRRKHPLARESDIIETLYMRLTLLNMTFGKHIERKYCCFFAGEILDEIYKILHYVECTPNLNRAYKVTDELFDLSTMAMEYFKEHIEPSLPEVTYFATDVFEYPAFTTVKAQRAILDETAAVTAEASYRPPPCTLQTLNKRLTAISKKVNRNSKEIVSLKRSVKVINQKINSLGEVVNQMKWKQKSCDTSALPHKINENHKISEIVVQLNMCKQEIEHLTSKLSVCSDKDYKLDLWENLESSMSSVNDFNYIANQSLNVTSSVSSSRVMNPKRFLEMSENSEFSNIKSPSLVSTIQKSGKRKFPSSTITSMAECSEWKRHCTIEELNDSGIQEEQISS